MNERRLDTRKLINSTVRLYHPELGRVDGVIIDISEGGAGIQLNVFKDMSVECEESPLFLRPINLDVLFPVSFLRQNDLELVVRFLTDEYEAR